MKWIALQAITEERSILYNYIPILIPLKNFGKDPDNTFRKYNIQQITYQLFELNNISTDFLKDSFSTNKVLFLLDGLDEVAEEGLRREIINWIQNQNILRTLLIITSRFSGIHVAKGITFNSTVPVYEIQNFTRDDVVEFLDNWNKHIELAVNDSENSAIAIDKAFKNSIDLVKVINNPNHKSLISLAINPLLLTIIAIVHRTRAVLPKERHKLYEEAIKVMIELWNLANRNIELNYTVENSTSHLSTIAVYLMKNNTRELSDDEIRAILPTKVEGKPVDSFLYEMILKSGLLYVSEGKYGFLHLTFQEYLAARYFARSGDQNLILEHIDKDFWIETMRLFVNIGNTHVFFNEIISRIKIGTFRNLNFALEIAREIVIEDEKQKYIGEIINFLLPKLLKYENTVEDSKEIFDVFYPSMEVYFNYPNKMSEICLNVVKNSKNNFAKNIAVLILYNCGIVFQKDLTAFLKKEIEEIETEFERFQKEFEEIEVQKKKINTVDAMRIVEDKIASLEFYLISVHLTVFNIFAVHTRDINDFTFLISKLKSKVPLIQYMVISALRDYDPLRWLSTNLRVNAIALFKPIEDQGSLVDISEEKIELLNSLTTPTTFLELNSEDQFTYWKELRPLWQIQQFQKVFNSQKKSITKCQYDILAAADNLTDSIEALSKDQKTTIFSNS